MGSGVVKGMGQGQAWHGEAGGNGLDDPGGIKRCVVMGKRRKEKEMDETTELKLIPIPTPGSCDLILELIPIL